MAVATLPVTVAICTRDRRTTLGRALSSVESQVPRPDEILVVDNGPDPELPQWLATEHSSARLRVEPVPGLDFARNHALREARHDIVLFLDDDAVAEPGWAAAATRPFLDDPRVGATTGRVEALSLETEGQRLFEANGGFARGLEPVTLPDDADRLLHGRRAPLIAWAVSIGSGCSMGVRRGAAMALGGFDHALDLGAALPGGGDHDMLWRLLQAGHRVAYRPDALARHEHRKSRQEAESQIVGHQRALIALLTKHLTRGPAQRRWSVAAFLAWRLTKPGVRLVHRLLGRDPLPAPLLFRMWGACWQGLLGYQRGQATARSRLAAATG